MNGASVLLVDDEFFIASMVEDALTDAGFSVTCAASGDEAIATLNAPDQNFAGLITDIRMPGDADGWDVARHARDHQPAFPVVYMTGDSAIDWGANGVPNSVLIQKPFSTGQIVSAISMLLHDGTPNG